MTATLRSINDLTLSDLEGIRMLLRGGSIIDWHRLNFAVKDEARAFARLQGFDLEDPRNQRRIEEVKSRAIEYLRKHFDFPVPKPVAQINLIDLLMLASSTGHRQVCACTILKVMHIIHHLDARELLFLLPVANEEVFRWVEHQVYTIMSEALTNQFPIVEFSGGQKNKEALYTKLLSKPDASAVQIYDKVRFRIVTNEPEDVFPILNFILRTIVPFNFIITGQSTNTLIQFHEYCASKPALEQLIPHLQLPLDLEENLSSLDNRFTAPSYRVVHFVAEVPIQVPGPLLEIAPPAIEKLGRWIFVQTEFQVLDRETDRMNESGDASHAAYKERQKLAVKHRLQVGRLS